MSLRHASYHTLEKNSIVPFTISHLFNEGENGKKAKAALNSDCKGSVVIHQGQKRKRPFKTLDHRKNKKKILWQRRDQTRLI